MAGRGFVKLMRTEKAEALMRNPNAFTLASVIAYRAQRTDTFNVHSLAVGEALLGDHTKYGLTQSQYRTAKKNLKKWQIAAFKSTNRGTIARLLDDEVYDINREQDDKQHDNPDDRQMTSRSQADDKQMTTTKKLRSKEGKNEKNSLSESALSLASLFLEEIRAVKPDFRGPDDIEGWARVFQSMLTDDGRSAERVAAVISYATQDSFWRSRIMEPEALRKHFDKLDDQEREQAREEEAEVKLATCAHCGGQGDPASMREVSGLRYCTYKCRQAALGW
ncbi:MAG: hypothetical protein ACYTAS_10675 [Planctomycetota bacterium]|jgi:hypothetical protein